MKTYYDTVPSPIGELLLTSNGDALTGVHMEIRRYPPERTPDWLHDFAPLREAARQLAEYFSGRRRVFDLPLAPSGTAFQLRVWELLREIPYGDKISYGELARRAGDPKASRAVGAANGRNPISIIVPCHRVIGANGSLVGFGGGLDRKRALLEMEARYRWMGHGASA